MHSDVEQEGFYQNCKFGDPRGRGSDPRAGPNLVHSVCVKHLYNIFFNAIDSKLKFNGCLE